MAYNHFLFITLILLTVIVNTGAQILLKLGAGGFSLNIYLLGGLCGYGIGAMLYILVLSKLNLSLTYPLVIGLTVIATTFAGAFFLKEQVVSTQWVGIGLMLSGICAIAFSKIT